MCRETAGANAGSAPRWQPESSWEIHPQPELFGPFRSDLPKIESIKLEGGDTSGQCLRGLPQERRGRAAENQEPRWMSRAVREHTQSREQIRAALNLVDDHQTAKAAECK